MTTYFQTNDPFTGSSWGTIILYPKISWPFKGYARIVLYC